MKLNLPIRQANVQEALRILDLAGTEAPRPGDEMPDRSPRAEVSAETDRLLRKAIRTKHLLRFRYKAQERVAEPHDYGIQNGVVRLFCYQVGGRSSGRLPGWRLVDVSEMQDCEILEHRFAGNREAPSGKHHRWDEVFIRVAAPSNRP